MKKEGWREIGEIIRDRWRTCLSEHAISRVAEWSKVKNFDPDESHLIELPVFWLLDGFTKGCDPSRFSPERRRQHAADMIKQNYWQSDDLNGRPRGEGLRVAATLSHYFYEEWRAENQKRGVRDYGCRSEMKDYAAEVIVKDFFAWRFREGVRPVFLWQMGWPKGVESLIENVRELMDKPKSRRTPGVGEELVFPAALQGLLLDLPPKPSKKR